MFLGLKKDQHLALEINGDVITNSREVKLLDVTLDSQLNFKNHATALYEGQSYSDCICKVCEIYRHPKSKITLSVIHCVNVQVLPFDLDVLWKSSKRQHRQSTQT